MAAADDLMWEYIHSIGHPKRVEFDAFLEHYVKAPPPRSWLKQHRKPRLGPNEPMLTGVTYHGHTGGPKCLCPYCPTELERLEADLIDPEVRQ